MNASFLRVHDTTIPHLDIIEKTLLDELIKQGRAEIISEMPGKPGGTRANIRSVSHRHSRQEFPDALKKGEL